MLGFPRMTLDPNDIKPEYLARIQQLAEETGQTEAEVLNRILAHVFQDLASIRKGYDDFKSGRYTELDEADAEFRKQNDIRGGEATCERA